MLVLTLTMYFLFGFTGGNSLYPSFADSLNNIALLTFGFGDYDSIYKGSPRVRLRGRFRFAIILYFGDFHANGQQEDGHEHVACRFHQRVPIENDRRFVVAASHERRA